MIAYKLFKVRKDNTLGSLFINRKQIIPIDKWLQASCYPTKGYKVRQGWHVTAKSIAPHLSMKNRIWCQVEIRDYMEFKRPQSQGGLWYISQWIKVLRHENQNH